MLRISHISPHFFRPLILAGALLLLCLSSCTRVHSIREARTIVAEADSLRNAGISLSPSTFHLSPSKSDSTTIASAVSALEHVRLIYPTAYAHANYYYGRLLREAGNHPEAMLAFLRVVHSRTKDHIIKGRSWSNIANMCRLAAEHGLAYDINEKSSEEFLLSDDSLMYFYALNNRAFDLAADSLKDRAIDLTNYIERICTDSNVLTKIWETRAEAYKNAKMYDSVIYCVRELQSRGNDEPTGYMLLAQAYNSLGQDDSAVYYAHKTIEKSDFYGDIYNALYILTHSDTTLTKQEILTMTSERADISMQDFTPDREKLAIAVDLLEQDLTRKPNLTWLWTLLATLCVIATSISIYIRKKKAKHQLISQQVDNLRQEQAVLSSQTQHLKSVNTECEEQVKHNITLFCQKVLLSPNPQEVISWDNYKQMRAIINENFFGLADKLEDLGLADHEVRFCVLVLLRFNRKKSAEWMRLGVASIGGKKRDIAMKLGQKSAHLYDFLLSLALK
ncbi:MAG: hypothetical protein IKO66_04275 [Paludibacteraceae bacterium]|nr:hypothetical protein [Paludibacteraceae bacterium]